MSSPARKDPLDIVLHALDKPLHLALTHLLKAHDLACNLKRPVWDLAVEEAELRLLGVTRLDLRGLVGAGLALHAAEQTQADQEQRVFGPIRSGLHVGTNACFVLTEAGVAAAREVADRYHDPCYLDVPHWNAELKVLTFRGLVVKEFRRPAPVQFLILAAFQEELWPRRIDDPLPPHPEHDSVARLHDAAKQLNRSHAHRLLRFGADGSGEGICWEPLAA
jgi:hypothetical protein